MSKRMNAPVVSKIANSAKATLHGKMTRPAIGVRSGRGRDNKLTVRLSSYSRDNRRAALHPAYVGPIRQALPVQIEISILTQL